MTYFQLLNIPPAFEIDLSALEAAYFKAQRQFHPDRFVNKSPEERLSALQKSMDINAAYETLKNPLKRAQYLLFLQEIIVGTEKDSIKPAPTLLMEVMELREEPLPQEKLKEMVKKSEMLIADYYKTSKFLKMAQETFRLGYLMRLINSIL
jgi:molecular chaperone HscB